MYINVSEYLTRDRICENRFCILIVSFLFTMWFTRGEWQRDGVEERRHGVPQVFRNTCGTPVRSTLIQLALKKGQTMPGVECKWMVCGGCTNIGSTKYMHLYTCVYVLLTHNINQYYILHWCMILYKYYITLQVHANVCFVEHRRGVGLSLPECPPSRRCHLPPKNMLGNSV